MYKREESKCPEWFERPSPKIDHERPRQMTLFRALLHNQLAVLRVSTDELLRWIDKGWVSDTCLTVKEVDLIDDPTLLEIEFVRDVVRSGFSDAQIECLFGELPKPYAYDPRCVTFSFRYGWVSPAFVREPEPECVIDEHLDAWLKHQDKKVLLGLLDRVTAIIELQSEENSDT